MKWFTHKKGELKCLIRTEVVLKSYDLVMEIHLNSFNKNRSCIEMQFIMELILVTSLIRTEVVLK